MRCIYTIRQHPFSGILLYGMIRLGSAEYSVAMGYIKINHLNSEFKYEQ